MELQGQNVFMLGWSQQVHFVYVEVGGPQLTVAGIFRSSKSVHIYLFRLRRPTEISVFARNIYYVIVFFCQLT